MPHWFASLNDKQREAVVAPMGPVLVLAGAGSGKTRVLTYRIAYLLKEKIFKPEEILALTFTNKAAGEMKQRIVALLTEKQKNQKTKEQEVFQFIGSSVFSSITMGTFHSVCARILRSEIENLTPSFSPLVRGRARGGYDRNFTIYDEDDALKVLKQILIEKHLSERFRPQVFRYYISQAKNRLTAPADLDLENSFFSETLQEIYEEYEKRLRESNALDFDDLLKLMCELLSGYPKVLLKYQDRFKCVLVDEYQDTNHAQYVLLKRLVQKHQNLFVVGDDAQSIYGFRGANMRNILDFKKDFPKARVIMLEQNYRSTQNILDAASKIISLNPFQYEKKLWTDNEGGSKVHLYEAVNEVDEAEFVIKSIMYPVSSIKYQNHSSLSYENEETPLLNRFLKGEKKRFFNPILDTKSQIPDTLNDFVVLYRTHAQSRPFEEVLLPAGIPYQIIGGIKFYERKEIKDVLAYLRLVVNPRDLVSLSRVINTPARGIGPATFKDVVKALLKCDFDYSRLFLNAEKNEVKDFFGLFVKGARLPKARNILDLMEFLLSRSGYKDSLLDGSEEGETRWENVEELFNVAGKYKNLAWDEGLSAFLEEAALMTDLDSLDERQNRLTLMTLHSAKGLEFEEVFFVGLEEGLLPHSRSLDSPEEIAEEVRLAYVGMTRAKKNLYLSYARTRQTYGELKRAVPSRVIKAIPKKLINKISNF